jgi:SAM-dependent methyltransferase
MAASDDLAAALQRTRDSYDATPYVHAPMMRSHPGRLAARAVWAGLPAPKITRVLEIGCASGGNLLPMAATLPDAHFLGVDLSPAQIAAGEARRVRYGLQNVELRADSFEALGEADGLFDVIICHGVYSWIPEPLRESLMAAIRARLAPEGVAMVSFNVLPGWRLFQIARDSLLLHARMIDDPARRAQATQELFAKLATESANRHTYGKFWRDEARDMARAGDAYLAHEIFEDSNAPETFADMTGRAARHGLAYLGEAAVVANSEADLAPEGAETIRALSGGDRLKRETYIDIFSGRSFREAVLVHAGREIVEAPSPEGLAALHFIPALELGLGQAPDGADVYGLKLKKTELEAHGAAAGEALRRLLRRRPASSRLADLGGEEVADLLRAAVEAGLVAISTQPVACASRLPERPRLWPIAAWEAQASGGSVTLRHSAFTLSAMQRLLAPLTDGTRSRDDLVAAAVAMAGRGELSVSGPEGVVADPEELARRLATATDNALAGFLRNGLLVED